MKTTRSTLAKTTLALLVTAGLLGSASTNAATMTWGGSATNSLSNAAAWVGGVAPSSGDNWVFGTASLTITNNLAQNFTVAGITFNNVTNFVSSATNATSQFLTLTGGITNSQTTAALVNFNNWNFIINTSVLFTNTMNSASSQMRPGQLSGTGTITYGANGGSARLILQPGAGNNNAFTGRLIAESGRVDIGATNGISSNTAYTFNNSGSVYLGGTNGETNLSFGVLDGTNAAAIIQNSTASNSKSFSVGGKNINGDFGGVIGTNNSSTISIVKVGTATQTLSGANTYNGTTTISNGVLQLGNGGTKGSISNSTSITLSGGSLAVNRSDAVSQGGIFASSALTGSGGFIQAGAGTTTLTATNTYTGTTTISAGSLKLAAGSSLASTNIVVNSTFDLTAQASGWSLTNGQTLAGSGTVTTASGQSVTAASGSTLSPGNSPGNLTVSSLILNGGANYNWQVWDANGVAGTGYDIITAGTLNLSNLTSSNKFNINLWTLSSSTATNGAATNFNTANSYTWTLASYTNLTGTFNTNFFNINTSATNGTAGFANIFAGNFALITSNNSLVLTYSAGIAPNTWTNASGNLSTITITNGATLTFDGTGTGGTVTNNVAVQALKNVIFSSGTTVNYTLAGTAITLDAGVTNSSTKAQTLSLPLTLTAGQTFNAAGAALTVSGTIDNGGYALTLDGANQSTLSGALSGEGSIVKNGAGTATLSSSNSFSGGTVLNAGTLEVGDASALGTGSLNAASNSVLQATASATLANAVVLSSGATLTVNDNGNALGLSGVVSGSGSLSKNGAGTLTLGGNNSYSGSTIVNAGVLALNGSNSTTGTLTVNTGATVKMGNSNALGSSAVTVNSGAAVDLAGNNLTTASIAGTGKVTNSTGSATITLGDAGSTTFAGALADGGGTLTLVKTNSGTVTLTGANTASGGATVAAGVLSLSNASFGSTITTATGATLKASGSTLNGASIGGNGTSSGTTIGSANFTVSNSTLNGVVTIGGPSAGTIAYAAPNMPSGALGANYGYAQFSNGVTATNLVVNGRLDIATGTYNLSNISGATNNGNVNYAGGGSGAIVYNSTTSNNLGFVGGSAFSGFFLGTNAVASLTQSGSGTTYFGMFGQPAGNTVAATNSAVTFSGGNWAVGQFGQNNGYQIAAGTFTLLSNAAITVGGNTGAGGVGYTHGNFNLTSGSMTFNGDTSESGGGAGALANTLSFTVGSSGTLTINGKLQLGVNGTTGNVLSPSSLTVKGGVVNVTNSLVLGNAAGLTAVNNDIINVAVNSGTLSVGANGITVGYNSTSGVVVNEQNTLTLSGGKLLSAGAIGAPTSVNAGSSITSSFVWTGGQLSASAVNASNSQWNGVGSSIAGNTLTNSNGVLAPGDIGTAGRTTINGNYTQTGNGTLALDFGGALSANSFTNGVGYSDQLSVSSNATIGGKILVNLTPTAFYGIGASAASNIALVSALNLNASSANISWDNGDVFGTLKSNNGVTVTLSTNGTSLLASFTRNTWIGGGNWGSGGAGAWSMGIDPNGTNSFAYFDSNSTVNLDRSSTVYSLAFGGGNNTLSSDNGSSLTLSPGVGTTVFLGTGAGSNAVTVPVTLAGDLLSTGGGTLTLSSVNVGTNSVTVNSGSLSLAGDSSSTGAITVTGGSLSDSLNISGTNGVNVTGGSLNLAGSNSYTGGTVLKSGTLEATYNPSSAITASSSGVTFIANMGVNTPAWAAGALSTIAATMTNATLGVDASGTSIALTDAIANTKGGITLAAYGSGTTALVSGTDYSGVSKWAANGGTLSVTNGTVLGSKSITLTGNGVLSLDGNSQINLANDVTVTSGGFTGSIVNNTGFTTGLSGTLTKNNAILKLLKGAFNVTGNIVGSSANSDLYVSSGANVTLSGSNSFNGPTHVDTGSTLALGSVNALPTNTALVLGSGSDLAGQVNTLNIGSYNATATSLTASGLSSNVVAGSGTLSLSGDLTASTGSTLDLGVALTGVKNVNLNGGTLLLNTGSSINSTANVAMNGGTLSVGTAPSSFSNLTLTGNSVINFAGLTAGTSITFSGIANLNGNSLSVYNWNADNHLNFTQGALTSGLSSADLVNISFYSDMGTTLAVPGNGGSAFSGNEIVPVPEPSVILAAILMVALIAFAKREEISRLARRVAVR
jgi:autotransporter-associated beta strand protein